MSRPRTVKSVIHRMREIDATLSPDDGVAVFNRMYLTVTERIDAILSGGEHPTTFRDPAAMADLDVRFAGLWLSAYEAATGGRPVPTVWRPLFEARERELVPVQYAIAGMNAHIEHDLPIAVIETCAGRGLEPAALHQDYEAVNQVLAQVESAVRRSFLDECGRGLDDRLGPVVHLLSAWNIDKARDLSWVTVDTLWALRHLSFVRDRFADSLAHTVAMASRTLLTPVC